MMDSSLNRGHTHIDPKIARNPCERKSNLLGVPNARNACIFGGVETIGQRVKKLRTAKGWSRPKLGKLMGKAIQREPFSGELIRLYEMDKNRPGKDAARALASVFSKSEQYIMYGDPIQVSASANESAAAASTGGPNINRLVQAFGWLTDAQKEKILLEIESMAAANKAIAKEFGTRLEPQLEVRAELRPAHRPSAPKKQRS